jgi:hypothetical protein
MVRSSGARAVPNSQRQNQTLKIEMRGNPVVFHLPPANVAARDMTCSFLGVDIRYLPLAVRKYLRLPSLSPHSSIFRILPLGKAGS